MLHYQMLVLFRTTKKLQSFVKRLSKMNFTHEIVVVVFVANFRNTLETSHRTKLSQHALLRNTTHQQAFL